MARLATFADVADSALGGFQRGQAVREDLNKRKRLAHIATQLEGGDFREGARAAFAAGDLQAGIGLARLAMQGDASARAGLPKAPTGFTFNNPSDPAAGVTPIPGFIEAKERLRRAGAPNITNTTNIASPKFQTKFDETTGKKLGEDALMIAQAGASASGRIGTLKRMQTALKTTATGFGQKQLLNVRKAAKTLGFDVGNVGEAETLQALGNQLALELRNPSGGAGMPGAMSDKDREFLVSSVPGLDKTPDGNRKLIDYAIRVEERKQQVAKFATQYRKENQGRLDIGFYDALAQWSEQNPLFTGADEPAPAAPAAQFNEGATATNPATGEKVIFQGGQWVPAQ
ncbi:MAG: hypothetical protein AAGF86_12755 [Pseudomonadota bacterium]